MLNNILMGIVLLIAIVFSAWWAYESWREYDQSRH